MRVHDVIAKEQLTLEAYVAAVETTMWASLIELQLGAEILEIRVGHMHEGAYVTLGNAKKEEKYIIAYREKHFVLLKKNACESKVGQAPMDRGGMNPWTDWQQGQGNHDNDDILDWARTAEHGLR